MMRTMTTRRGYTLIELMVSVAIFAIVMLAATAAYLAFVNYNRRAAQVASLLNGLSFGLDAVARDIRTGTDYSCSVSGTTCTTTQQSSGVSTFYFTDADGCSVTYRFSAGVLSKSVVGEETPDGFDCVAKTDVGVVGGDTTPGVTIDSVKFYVRGAKNDDSLQPLATLVIRGSTLIVDTGEEIPFSIETSATSRVPDAPSATP